MKAVDVMTRNVVSVKLDSSVFEAAQRMILNRISGLPVLDASGKLVGVVTEGDLLRRAETATERHRPSWLEFFLGQGRLATEYVRTHGRKVGDVMTPGPETIVEETPLDEIVTVMEQKRIKRLPVMRGDKMVGIVSRANLVQALATLARETADTLPSDAALRELVLAEIDKQSWSPGHLINVIARDGVVELWGTILDERKRQALRVVARQCRARPSTKSLRIGRRVSDALRKLPVVRSVAQRVGRAEKAYDTWGTHYSEFEVDLKPLSGEEAEEAQADVRKALSGFLGVNFSVKTFLTERVEETLSGYTAAVAVNVFGNDLDVLDQKAQEIARVLGEVPGATDVQIQSPPGLPQLTIRLRKPDLERWGFDAVEVLDLVRAAYQGDVVGQTYQGNQVFNVITILDADNRRHVTEVGSLPLRSPGGAYVLLKQVADVFESPGRYQVLHEGARRLQTVTANVAGNDVAAFVRAAQAAIAAKVQLPAGSYLQFAGTAEAQAQSQRDLTVNALVAGLGIVLLLSIITRNWQNLLLVLANLPFAMVGGVLAVFATGGVLSLGGMVGFVTLLGITLRNSILMIAHYEHLVEVEGMTWGLDAAIRGAGDRLTPILMTSIVTGLGVLPLAIGAGDAGREIEGPMAIVILGGLLTSMALNLLVLPILALRFGRFEPAIDEFSSDPVGLVRNGSDGIRLPSREAQVSSELDAAARDEFARNSAARGAAPGENRKPDAHDHAGALRAECRGSPRDGWSRRRRGRCSRRRSLQALWKDSRA